MIKKLFEYRIGRPTTVPPSGSRSEEHLLGSNLTDEEFKVLLEVVGTSHDGKISLTEFDKIVNSSNINSSNGSKRGPSNNNMHKNGSSASHPTNEYGTRDVEFDVLNYDKFDKKNKIAWDKVREIRNSLNRGNTNHDTRQPQNASSLSAKSYHQSTDRPHQISRGRNLVPDKFSRRSHSLNGLGSPRPQDTQGSFKKGQETLINS